MREHTEHFKFEVVQYYLNGFGGCKDTGRQYGITGALVRRWVTFYLEQGLDGLTRKAYTTYSALQKLSVLQQMWENELSYSRAAAMFDVRGQCIIASWDRAYRAGGIEALVPRPRGRPSAMNGPTTQPDKPDSPEESNSVKDALLTREQLLDEIESLRIENAILKKYDALVQSRAIPPMRKKRGS
jgi:transposase